MKNNARYIEIAGSVASGKTSLAQAFGMRAHLVQEDPSQNPFVSTFAENRHLQSFCSQSSFMMSKIYQVSRALERGVDILTDFSLSHVVGHIAYWMDKQPESTELLLKNFKFLRRQLPQPDAIISLECSAIEQRRRIEEKGNDFECDFWSLDAIKRLNTKLYESFEMFAPPNVPVIVVQAKEINLEDPCYIDSLWQEVHDKTKKSPLRTPVLRS